MASAVTPVWTQPAAHTTPTAPSLDYQAAHTGRPPGVVSGWGGVDGWTGLANSSLVVVENNFTVLESVPTLANKTLWPAGPVIHLGVEVELFPEWVVGVWTGVLVTLMAVGVGGNVLVPVVVMRTRDLRSSTNLLLVNLAAADLLVLLVSLPTALIELHSRPETWVLGEPMCEYRLSCCSFLHAPSCSTHLTATFIIDLLRQGSICVNFSPFSPFINCIYRQISHCYTHSTH